MYGTVILTELPELFTRKGEGKTFALIFEMRDSFTILEIMTVIAIICVLMMIAIPVLLEARRTANENTAQANLRTLSLAAEVYAINHNGEYPDNIDKLKRYTSSAPYLCGNTVHAYIYDCNGLESTGYTITARPANCGISGTKYFTISTGGVLNSTACE